MANFLGKYGLSERQGARRPGPRPSTGVDLTGNPLQLLRFSEDMQLAVELGALTHEEATDALKQAQGMTADEISQMRSYLNANSFGGEILSNLLGALRDQGADL